MTDVSDRSLKEAVVVVTGAGTGIGRATAVGFAEAGAFVVCGDIDEASGRETTSLVQDMTLGTYVHVDVAKEGELRQIVRRAVELYGRLDVMINNAGISMAVPIENISNVEWDRVIDVNLKGTFFGCKYALEAMIEGGGGAIVNVASDMGLSAGLPNQPAYIASKGGVVLLTKALAVDFARRNIRVNCVCPCITDTPMLDKFVYTQFRTDSQRENARKDLENIQPIGRMCTPEEVAQAILFLAAERASGITGVALPVDGGFAAQ